MVARNARQMIVATLTCFWVGAALAAEEGHGEPPNLFAGTPGNVLVTLVIFGIVVFMLGKYVWPPMMSVLEKREQTIRESLEDAKREREAAEDLLKKYTEQIEKAKSEAAEIIEKGRRNGEDVSRRIQEEARKEAQATVERGLREIQLAADAARKDVYDLASQLAVDVAGRIIKKELSAKDHEKLVAESLDRMRQSGAKMN